MEYLQTVDYIVCDFNIPFIGPPPPPPQPSIHVSNIHRLTQISFINVTLNADHIQMRLFGMARRGARWLTSRKYRCICSSHIIIIISVNVTAALWRRCNGVCVCAYTSTNSISFNRQLTIPTNCIFNVAAAVCESGRFQYSIHGPLFLFDL